LYREYLTYKISKLVQLPMLSGIGPVKLFPLTSLKNHGKHIRITKIRTEVENKLSTYEKSQYDRAWLLTSTTIQIIGKYQETKFQSTCSLAIHCIIVQNISQLKY